jgi:environmental stress-induced protein Ves
LHRRIHHLSTSKTRIRDKGLHFGPDSALMAVVPQTMQLIRFADLDPVPWRNGGGLTREIATAPYDGKSDSFRWRVSIADVTSEGPFSAFEEVDRQLVLVEGAGMVISVDGKPHLLSLFDVLAFPGDAPCVGTLVDGPTRDLNVMTRRGEAAAAIQIVSVPGGHAVRAEAEAERLVVALTGSMSVATGEEAVHLDRFDTVRISVPAAVELTGTGRVAVVDVQA